jgi:hypothetical protein
MGGTEMAVLRIEGFPDALYRKLKIEAATKGVTVKSLVITGAQKVLGKKYDPMEDPEEDR